MDMSASLNPRWCADQSADRRYPRVVSPLSTMSGVSLVALVSAYKEGPLALGAIRSALAAEPDRCLVMEGPAGDEIEDCPDTDYPARKGRGYDLRYGTWRADAEKRTAMVETVRAWNLPPPVWGVWVDGDEILCNGEYLRDILQALQWEDEANGASIDDPDNLPTMGRPIRIVEPSGLIITCRAKVIRLDLIRRYVVSSSVVESVLGGYMGEGNKPDSLSKWFDDRELFAAKDYAFYAHPPLPCEPFLQHRSWLRHPNRRNVRMSEQEMHEFKRETEERGLLVAED